MPLPDGERSQAQINSVFGDEQVDAETGNYILNVIYWRRASGALIDVGIRFPNDSRVTDRQAAKALDYIRSLDPSFDEQAAAQVWAEEESVRLQQQLEDRAVKLRLYKRDEPQEEEEEAEEDQGTAYGRSRNRESQLEQLQASNEAIKEAEAARKAVAEAKAEGSALHTHRGPLELAGGVQPSVEMVTYTGRDGITISRPKQQAWLQPVERKPWVSYYEKQAELFPSESIPQLSNLQRLGPSFAFLLLLLGLAVFVSENYTPPPNSARLWPDVPPSVATLSALTGTFFAFFLLSRVPPLWRTLNKYFTVVPAYPHAFGILGAAFRHQRLSHLLFNSLSLWLFGLILHEDVGRGAFLSIFFLSGALGAYTSLSYHVLRRHWATYIFGSSGCVLGVVAAATTLHPNSTIKVFGQDVPIAVWLWLALYGVAEAVAMFRFKGLGIDHAGHLGGLVGGFASALWLQQKARERKIALGREAGSAVPVEVNEVKAAPS
ncbi:hypothetical protein BDY17DRAFT_248564 [Neohortaea acidophila]|uniref:Peptidase S54 rhomboid domain-containing protein n=1 Tax=Neohortaea acidophila TaxID=245834 RepID=A0A6A6PX12_9PEZI|nr:uncharacterized protein BDY17DRAFT_248564 [Neohortaea acidophila]KAF2484291.1 hypothetical protein BDY17DRAFT_248564 [Neohortaea acidophila]